MKNTLTHFIQLSLFLGLSLSAFASYTWQIPSTSTVGSSYYVYVESSEPDEYLEVYKNGSYFASGWGSAEAVSTDTVAANAEYTVYGSYGSDTVYVQCLLASVPPVATISVNGYSSGASVQRPLFGGITITANYCATDGNADLTGIRYNVWNQTTGYFDNGGGGYQTASGGSGQYQKTITMETDGDWYFWTDAIDSSGNYASSGPWTGGFKITVGPPPNQPPDGWVDGVSTPNVPYKGIVYGSGWAADYEMGAPVTRVDMYIDGVLKGPATLNVYYPHVEEANRTWMKLSPKDISYSGFTFALDTSPLNVGEHTITARAYDIEGSSAWLKPLEGRKFNIVARESSFSFSPTSFTYNGAIQNPTITPYPSDATYSTSGTTSATAGGDYSVTATATGNYTGTNTASWSISKASQTIIFPNPGNKTFGDPPFTLSATASSGLSIEYSVVSGPATVSGNICTLTGAGSVTLRASQSGDSNYLPANNVDAPFDVARKPTIFTISPLSFTYNGFSRGPTITPNPPEATFTPSETPTATNPGNYTVTATATGNYIGDRTEPWEILKAPQAAVTLTPAPDQTVTVGGSITFYASGGSGTGQYTWGGAASGEGPSNTVSFPNIGTYPVSVYRKGDSCYLDSVPVSVNVTVVRIPTTFTFAPISFIYDGSSHGPTITPNPPEATFTPSGTPTAINPGNYTVTATATGNYTGTDAASWTISNASQAAVTLTPSSNQTVTVGGSITFYASGGSGSGSYMWGGAASGEGASMTVSFPTAENYTVSVYRAGDQCYNQSETATVSVTVNSLINTTFDISPLTFTYNGSSQGPTITPTPTGATYTPSGTATATNPGTYSITATATAAYSGTGTKTWTINKATPIITWANPAAITQGTALSSTQLNATANIAGTFTYSPAAGTVLSATTHPLTVTFDPTDTALYSSTSKTVSLTVNAPPASPPSITTQPVSQVVAAGGSATFSVAVSSTTTATYQWYKNGSPISGANSAALILNNIQTSDTGSYYVVVTNQDGAVTSNSVQLMISISNAIILKGIDGQYYRINTIDFSITLEPAP